MNINQLSPLNFSGLIAFGRLNQAMLESLPVKKHRAAPVEVTMWRCPECDDLHDDEVDAEECCQGAEEECAIDDEPPPHCPVCNAELSDHHEAANCCLWKDFDAPTRWRIAEAVEAGGKWMDEIKRVMT